MLLNNFHWKWTRRVKVGYWVLMELCCCLGLGWGKWRSSSIHSTSLVDQGRRAREITIITVFFLFFKETRRIFWTHKKKSIQFWRSSSKGVISVSWLYCSCKLCLLVNWDYLLCVMTFEAVPCSGVYVAQRTECDRRQVEVTRWLPCCRLVGTVERWNIYGQKIAILFHFSPPLEWKRKIQQLIDFPFLCHVGFFSLCGTYFHSMRTEWWLQSVCFSWTTGQQCSPVDPSKWYFSFSLLLAGGNTSAAICTISAMAITFISKTDPGSHHSPCTWEDEGKWLPQGQGHPGH